jgi:uncharacterized protein YwgA
MFRRRAGFTYRPTSARMRVSDMSLTTKDWTLLVIASGRGRPLSPVQLQKAVFLLARNLTDEQRRTSSFYNFRPYDYGPFDAQVYRDAEQLRDDGLIVVDPSGGVAYRDYSATPQGVERADELRKQLNDKVIEYLDKVVAWVSSLSFTALVQAIYKAYPDMKAHSVFRG